MEKIKGQFTLDQVYDLTCFATYVSPMETVIFDGNVNDDDLELSSNELIAPFLEPGYKGHKSIVVLNDNENEFPVFCIIYPEIEESEENKFDLYFAKKIEMESFDKMIDSLDYIRNMFVEEIYENIRIMPSKDLTNEDISDSVFLNHYDNGLEQYTLFSYKYNEDLEIGHVLVKKRGK